MDFRFTEAEIEFQKEVDKFLRQEVTKETVAEIQSGQGFGPHSWEFLHKMGEKGWLCPHWPKEYGGLNSSYMKRFIISERVMYYGAPMALDAAIAGEILLTYGSEDMKKEYLLRIARGEIEFALGYTEPDAGTDLASLKTRAVRQGDDYIINGQKLYNTRCHYAHYHWLLARTEPDLPKHRGLSLFVVDLKSPGITIRPLNAMGVLRTNEVFYDDVRVPAKNLVGKENRGWYQAMTALEEERVGFSFMFFNQRMVEELLEYCRQTKNNKGVALIEDPVVRQKVAQVMIEFMIANLLRLRAAGMLAKGERPTRESLLLKIFPTEANYRMLSYALQIQGLYGQLRQESKWARLPFDREYLTSILSFIGGGGSNEIVRDVLAQRELGLPRS